MTTLGRLRKPLFFVALLLALVLVQVERSRLDAALAAAFVSGAAVSLDQADFSALTQYLPADQREELEELMAEKADEARERLTPDVTGLAIPALQMVDGILLFSLLLIGVGMVLPAAWQARIQSPVTLIFAIVLLIFAFVKILAVFLPKLILMVSLLLAFPFGTIAYFFIYADFPRGAAAATLALLFTLQLLVGLFLLLAHQRYLENKGLVLIFITSLVANFIVALLHGIVPGFLVSITDAIAAIVVGIIAIIWAIILIIGSIIAIVMMLKGLVRI